MAKPSYDLMMSLLLLGVVAITGTHFSNACRIKCPKSLLESVFSYVQTVPRENVVPKSKLTPPVRENPVSATDKYTHTHFLLCSKQSMFKIGI